MKVSITWLLVANVLICKYWYSCIHEYWGYGGKFRIMNIKLFLRWFGVLPHRGDEIMQLKCTIYKIYTRLFWALCPYSYSTIYQRNHEIKFLIPIGFVWMAHVNSHMMFALVSASEVIMKDIWSWWRHQMETFSTLMALCEGNSPVTGEFPSQRPVTRSFDVFFDLYLHKRLIQ